MLFSCRTQRVILSGQDRAILPFRIANHRAVRFILPACGANHKIMLVIAFLVPVIHEDEPRKKSTARRATWDGSRDSSAVTQLLSGSKGLHGYGSSGRLLVSLFFLLTEMDCRKLSHRLNECAQVSHLPGTRLSETQPDSVSF